jgi:5-amino-6-(5-phosphoribosylamino)uracil reductase
MVEGGGTIHTQLMSQNLADEVHLAIAPLLVGQPEAARFLLIRRLPGRIDGPNEGA